MAITKARVKSDADAGAVLTVYANLAAFPTTGPSVGDQAFNQDNNKIYVWNGNGWFSVATVNQTPTWSTEPDDTYTLATNGTATTITVAATDPDGFPITYSASSSDIGSIATISQSGGTFSITPTTNVNNGGTFSVTFTATDGVNQVVKSGISFTLQFRVDDSNYTTLLLKASGTGNNEVAPTDLGPNSHTLTLSGDVSQTSFSPYRSGGYSLFFDGNGDYLTIPDSSDFNFATGNGDFTIECWIYKTNASESGWYTQRDTSTTELMIFLDHNISGYSVGQVSVEYDSAAYTFDAGIRQNVWQHIAFVRTGTTLKWFTDGVERDSRTEPASLADYAHEIYIGSWRSLTRYFEGYMYDFRVVNGTAVYTSAFTVPITRYGAVANTKLLLSGPGKFDKSDSKHAITVNGNVSSSTWTPYEYEQYSSSNFGGSAYFDGVGDYLQLQDNTDFDFPGEFAYEFWVYRTGMGSPNGTYQAIIAANGSGTNGLSFYITQSTGALSIYQSSFVISGSAGDIKDNIWHHVLLMRDSSNLLQLFIDGNRVSSSTVTGTFTDNSGGSGVRIGYDISANSYFKGFISDVRIVKGSTGGYSSGTTITVPTERLTAVTNTKLLLPMVQAKIYDAAQSAYDGHVAGSAVASSGQTHFSENTIYIPNGDNDYIEIPPDRGHLIYEGNYTVEAWLYPTSFSSTNNNYFLSKGNPAASATNREWAFGIVAGGLKVYWSTNGASSGDALITGTVTNNLNQWTHVAFTKYHNTIYIFKDGTFIDSGTFTSIYDTVHGATTVGRLFGYTGISHSYNGYIHDLRITKGLSRYPFVPEFQELSTTNSVATGTTVTASNVRVIGVYNSSSASTMTGTAASDITVALGSGTSVSTFAPYSGGGSIYMDGGAGPTTYASFTTSSQDGLFTFASDDDFGIEYYFYHNEIVGNSTSHRHINTNASGGLGFFKAGGGDPGGSNRFTIRRKGVGNDLSIPNYNSIFPPFKWHHVCVQRVSGTLEVYGNGTLLGSATGNTRTYPSGVVGFGSNNTTADNFNGYFSNLRVVKGQGIYSKNFTAPTSKLDA